MGSIKVTERRGNRDEIKMAGAYGLLNLVHAVEAAAKRDQVVAGGHRSFNPGGPIGGNLRRTGWSQVYFKGKPLDGQATSDDNGDPVPDLPEKDDADIRGFVGFSAHYALPVERGTTKMEARPTLEPALIKVVKDQGPALLKAGAQAWLQKNPLR